VVQDIVGLFIKALESKNMGNLLRVSHLTSQQEKHYSRIFGLYQSLSLKVMANSFILSKRNEVAEAKFEVSDLANSKGHQVESAANRLRMHSSSRLMESSENIVWICTGSPVSLMHDQPLLTGNRISTTSDHIVHSVEYHQQCSQNK
jgi:hypothetical protein